MEYALFSCWEVDKMKKENLKDRPSVICYIELLQNNISRMSGYSGIMKASMCVIYTAIITILLAIDKMHEYWWTAVVLTILCAIMDAYYLAIEKIYVIKYNKFVNDLNENKLDENLVYDMKPKNTDLSCELLAMILSSMKSFSIIGFYFIFIIISLIIKFI